MADAFIKTDPDGVVDQDGDAPMASPSFKPSSLMTQVRIPPPGETPPLSAGPQKTDVTSIPQMHKIVIPSYASWFLLLRIHEIEIRAMPEFFDSRSPLKTPLAYTNYRNFMVNTYRLNPNEYLLLTAVRRNLAGDVGALLRIHRFLSRWGIINYQVNPENRPAGVEPPAIDPHVLYDHPRGLFPFESFVLPDETEKVEKLKEIVGNTSAASGEPQRPKIVEKNDDAQWSPEELKKLLEAVQNGPSGRPDWSKIAASVGTKTPEQCVARFMKLPIEDTYLDEASGPLKYAPHLPYSKADNPVISSIAFLCSLVDADTVAAATNRAIRSLDEAEIKKLEGDSAKIEPLEGGPEDPESKLREGVAAALGTAGARLHVFATYEERQLNKVLSQIADREIKKVDIKLDRLRAAELELEIQRKRLAAMQEEVFLERLAFGKFQKAVHSNFVASHSELVKVTQSLREVGDEQAAEKLKNVEAQLAQAHAIINSNSRFTLCHEEPESVEETTTQEEGAPVSMEAPDLYKFWTG